MERDRFALSSTEGMAARTIVSSLSFVLLLLFGCGCGSADRVVPLDTWTLATPDGARAQVHLPLHAGDRVTPETPRYAIEAVADVPPEMRGRDLTLAIPFLPAKAELTCDGRPMASIDADSTKGYRGTWAHRWRIPADVSAGGRLALVIAIENRWTQSAWLDSVPRLSATPDGDRGFLFIKRFNEVTAILALTIALFAGYVYLVVFLSDRRRTAHGWFALTGLSSVVYPTFILGFAQNIFGPFDVAVIGVGISTALIAGVRFTQAHFGFETKRSPYWSYSLALGAIGGSIFGIGYFRGTSVFGPLALAGAIPAIGYQATLLFRLSRMRPTPRHTYTILVPWVAVAVLGSTDFAAWVGMGELLGGLHGACLGILAIAFFQTTAVSREHIFSLAKADELAAERIARIHLLETHNREVDVLNDELRRQIAARSSELADALARMGASLGEPVALHPGDILEERYRVIRVIGSGGAGTVYQVDRLKDQKPLALKVVHGITSPSGLARFAREAQIAAQIDHPNVISIVDVDVASAGYLFIVMELIDGPSLRGHKESFGNDAWAIPVLLQIAKGLAAIHGQGIVHRDLKPGNVLVIPAAPGERSRVKIADFGIASAAKEPGGSNDSEDISTVNERGGERLPAEYANEAEGELSLTMTGAILGTPLYMAPELARGAKNATGSADLFSFGVLAFELLTGVLPFRESPAVALLHGRGMPAVPSIALIKAALDERVVSIVDRCLSLDPEKRPSTEEVARVLEGFAPRPRG